MADDRTLALDILKRQLPFILRGQNADGGWGDNSPIVFRALAKAGILNELSDIPPLPSDWKVVRAIPAPNGDLNTMVWREGVLWVHNRTTNEAVAISPEDGRIISTVPMPAENISGLGLWGDSLAVSQQEPMQLLKVNPKTGAIEKKFPLSGIEEVGPATQVGNEILIVDVYLGNIYALSPETGEFLGVRPTGWPIPIPMASEGDALWIKDDWFPSIIKVRNARTLDWDEQPFGGGTTGLAWDGENLWALDNRNSRICVIEKTESGKRIVKRLSTG